MNYYRELLDAVRHKDAEEKKRLISIIGDSKAAELKKRHKTGEPLTEEDIEILIKYQLKYALTSHDVAYIFEIDRNNYQKRVYKFLDANEQLRKEYECLINYNSSKYTSGGRRG